MQSDLKGKTMKINPLTDYYKSFFFHSISGNNKKSLRVHTIFPITSKPRVRLSLFLALCLVLCS